MMSEAEARADNKRLRAENEKLKAENKSTKKALCELAATRRRNLALGNSSPGVWEKNVIVTALKDNAAKDVKPVVKDGINSVPEVGLTEDEKADAAELVDKPAAAADARKGAKPAENDEEINIDFDDEDTNGGEEDNKKPPAAGLPAEEEKIEHVPEVIDLSNTDEEDNWSKKM